MKKKMMRIILTGVCVVCLMACGKSQKDEASEYYQEELGLSERDANELADALYGDETVQTSNNENKETEPEEPEQEEYERFSADPEWANYTFEDKVIQIDDTMCFLGCSLDEAIQKVDQSAVDYTYEYDPNSELHPQKIDQIIIYRGDQEWITIDYLNPYDDWNTIGDLVVVVYHPSEAAYEYGYFLNGMSYQEILSMRDTDIENLFAGYQDIDNNYLMEDYKFKFRVADEMDTEWTGNNIKRAFYYLFVYDKDYMITSMRIGFGGGCTWKSVK